MKVQKEKAMKLRLKGYSYNEIQKELGIPKSTLSGWFSDLQLSKVARKRLDDRVHQGVMNGLVKRNKAQTHLAQQRAKKIRGEARSEVKEYSKRDLLLIGVSLYWAEGYKRLRVIKGKERTHHTIQLTNADPDMLRLFIRFLHEVLHIEKPKITAGMRLYEHINEQEAKAFWSEKLSLPESQFKATTWLVSISSKRKKPFNRLSFGTVCITVNDTENFHRILGLIEGMKDRI